MLSKPRILTPRVGVASLSSTLEVGADRAAEAAEALAKLLEGFGCEVIKLGSVDAPDKAVEAGRKLAEAHVHAVAFAAVSWYEDYLVLDLLEECSLPVLLWSLPGIETGALCGNQQLTAYLKQLDAAYFCVHGTLESDEARRRAQGFLRATALKHRLRRARVGLAGHRVAGMTEVAANEFALKKAVGPRVVALDLPHLLSSAQDIPDEQARQRWQDVVSRSAACEVSDADGLDSMKMYAAVKDLVIEHRLDALTIGCYPHLMGRVCLAASLLADEGIPLGCEGDVNGAVGQLMLTLLTGEPTHNTDWLEPLQDGTVVLSHCGSASFSLAEDPKDITLAPVRLMHQGVCALFPARTGPVTLLNLMPQGNDYQVALLEGDAVSTEMVFPGNPLRVRFAQPVPAILDWIHDEGIGHHWMAGYGHVGREIRAWARLAEPDVCLIELHSSAIPE